MIIHSESSRCHEGDGKGLKGIIEQQTKNSLLPAHKGSCLSWTIIVESAKNYRNKLPWSQPCRKGTIKQSDDSETRKIIINIPSITSWFLSSSVHLHIWKSAKRQSQTQTARVVNDGHLITIFLKDMSRDISKNSISFGQISMPFTPNDLYPPIPRRKSHRETHNSFPFDVTWIGHK